MFPILIGDAIDCIVGRRAGGLPTHRGPCLTHAWRRGGITALAQWLMNVINNTHHLSGRCAILRDQAFRKIQVLPLSYLDSHPTARWSAASSPTSDQFADGLLMGFTQLFTGVLTILGTLIFMLTINVDDRARGGAAHAAFAVRGELYRKAHLLACSICQSETRGEQTALIDEMIGNQKVVQAFCP